MKVLLHVCCGPCAIYPLSVLRREHCEVHGFFFNPNIHPFREFKRRIRALEELAAIERLPVTIHREYGLRDYLRQVVFQEEKRCEICYAMRLLPTVEEAVRQRADAFTTTLLYSRYQQHAVIRRQAEELSRVYRIPFYYEDFRQGWQEGIDRSINLGLYRQPYCGCIFSEEERYDKRWRKKKKKGQ